MNLLPLEKILDRAARGYLLGDPTLFRTRIALDRARREELANLEQAIRDTGYLSVSRYRNEREGFTRVGRPVEVELRVDCLQSLRPELLAIRKSWNDAREAATTLALEEFLGKQYALCFRKAAILPACVRAAEYILASGEVLRGLFPRQIAHGESGKLLGREFLLLKLLSLGLEARGKTGPWTWDGIFSHFGIVDSRFAFEFYSPHLKIDGHEIRDFHGLIDPETAGRFKALTHGILVLENKESFLALRGRLDDCSLLLGSGRAIAAVGHALGAFPGKLLYWGDIDRAGYEIYSSLRQLRADARAICMDMATIDRYLELQQKVSGAEPGSRSVRGLEMEYERVCREGIRIEQEQIPLSEVIEAARF